MSGVATHTLFRIRSATSSTETEFIAVRLVTKEAEDNGRHTLHFAEAQLKIGCASLLPPDDTFAM